MQKIVNLIAKVKTNERGGLLNKLKQLYNKHPTDEIALEYARGIYNLVLKLKNERKRSKRMA